MRKLLLGGILFRMLRTNNRKRSLCQNPHSHFRDDMDQHHTPHQASVPRYLVLPAAKCLLPLQESRDLQGTQRKDNGISAKSHLEVYKVSPGGGYSDVKQNPPETIKMSVNTFLIFYQLSEIPCRMITRAVKKGVVPVSCVLVDRRQTAHVVCSRHLPGRT